MIECKSVHLGLQDLAGNTLLCVFLCHLSSCVDGIRGASQPREVKMPVVEGLHVPERPHKGFQSPNLKSPSALSLGGNLWQATKLGELLDNLA